ncbi:MAG: SUF system NifU family Fe-S cluster assembly protein [Deltaproteobacteria bacterium]|nr:SUF system NifU family Fe-S cluster assembly protein [Deltaproteobacteria bacterium]
MSNLDELYQEVILDHNRNPRNFRTIEGATNYAHGKNPLCGDDYEVYFNIDANGIIQDVGFQGAGCAISKSSASVMTTLVKQKTLAEALELAKTFHLLVTQDEVAAEIKTKAGKLKIFEGVKKFPVRVKCAMLAWRALEDALTSKDATHVVSTE